MTMAQYLSKYLFDKYKDESNFAASQCGLPISTSKKPESVSSMVDDDNITLTSLRIICNGIRDAFLKCAVLPEEAVHSLGKGYMEAEYRTYEYEKGKGMGKQHIYFC